ncbi:hypothetical protein BV898_13010 [Hypsibius exemplaris]|uniref:Uncharacterized protein n=1 Tax=Hypsibius exemplaris TaxID=2072580 RepID=A0A1W0WC49_HYPEX|nr:hypothetical protein BV898_13010 [Hypsibius exemplaris]
MDSATSSGLRCSNGHATVDYSNARVPRRQTLPRSSRSPPRGRIWKCLIDCRDALEKQFSALYTQLEGSLRGQESSTSRRFSALSRLHGRTSATAPRMDLGSNSTLFSFSSQRRHSFRGKQAERLSRQRLSAATTCRLSGGPRQKMAFDKSIDLTGRLQPAVSGFSSAWSYSGEDQRCSGLSDSFSAFDFPPKVELGPTAASQFVFVQRLFAITLRVSHHRLYSPGFGAPNVAVFQRQQELQLRQPQQDAFFLSRIRPSSETFSALPAVDCPAFQSTIPLTSDEEYEDARASIGRPGITADVLNNLVQQHHFTLERRYEFGTVASGPGESVLA